MKKGLSVLLIAAALFGFYGGAVNLNDVLACKDYWEEEGKKSTADLNKLEDGLNQLKDNEEAYLDGLDQIKDGEAELAKGEADYAAGQKELAKGEADYAAAPGKLADARKKLAAGEKKLADGRAALAKGEKDLAAGKKTYADGQESINGLTKLISGISQLQNGYDTWKPGYDKLKDGREQLYKGSKGSKGDLTDLAAFLPDASKKTYVAAVEDIAGDDEKQTAKDYKEFIKSTNTLETALPAIQAAVKAKSEEAATTLATLKTLASANPLTEDGRKAYITIAGACAQKKADLEQMSDLPAVTTKFKDEGATLAAAYMKFAPENAKLDALKEAAKQAADEYNKNPSAETGQAAQDAKNAAEAKAAVVKPLAADIIQKVAANKGTILDGVEQATKFLAGVNEKVNGSNSPIKNTLLPGLKQFNAAATSAAIDQLTGGQDTIASGISTVASAVIGNKTLREGVKSNLGESALVLLKAYSGSTNPLSTSMADFSKFEAQMDKTPGITTFLAKAKSLLAKTKADGLKSLAKGKKDLAAGKAKLAAGKKELAAGEKTLADGYAKYAQGLADYKAAPGKLADGRKKLAEGLEKLMDGREQLKEGKSKLAEYEDGEQQARDGLATLMATEANGGLKSILERRSGDDQFDDANGHLGLDEGLEAVEVGRGYQADSGELITEEITARAVGTAAGLGAGVLAVLAAILSFLKKNKGAGVLGCLSAVAGAVGVAYGTSKGMEFSNIAGSTAGNMPWIAAGVLAAAAAVFAIAHFAAKKEA